MSGRKKCLASFKERKKWVTFFRDRKCATWKRTESGRCGGGQRVGDVQEERGLGDVEEDRECRRLVTLSSSPVFFVLVSCAFPKIFFVNRWVTLILQKFFRKKLFVLIYEICFTKKNSEVNFTELILFRKICSVLFWKMLIKSFLKLFLWTFILWNCFFKNFYERCSPKTFQASSKEFFFCKKKCFVF